MVGCDQVECRVRTATDEMFRWRRFVAVATMDDPAGCHVVTNCPETDLGSLPMALAHHVLDSMMGEDVREAAVAAMMEGMAAALGLLADQYPEMAAPLR